ncbi:MAG: NAD-dependent protein deacetylase, SIR2 family [Clostridiales bacterium]|nr:NAD-dependent protein deacetylase, SIR2 family [Clostridiales bacterium]
MVQQITAKIEQLADQISLADAIVIGVGSGLSSAAGYNHYHWMPSMEKYLEDFKKYYGFSSPFAGFYYCYSSLEQQWAYYARYIYSMWHLPTGQPYLDLKEIVDGKDYFVLTTNVDMQCEWVFPKERLCSFQGNIGYFQCSQPCHDHLYENHEIIERMNQKIKGIVLPTEFVPRCPKCGRIMVPWVRDDTFLEGSDWKSSVKRYEDFLSNYLIQQPEKRVLFLELGVGEMTPSIIKLPFWSMASKNSQVFYACLNLEASSAPEHLKGRSMYITGDLADVLNELRKQIEERKIIK